MGAEVRAKNLVFQVDDQAKNVCYALLNETDEDVKGTDFWRLILDDGLRLEIPVFSHKQTGIVHRTENGLICEYSELVSEYGDVYPITFKVEITTDGELLYFTPSVENRTENVRINECFCPLADFDSLFGEKEKDVLYVPEGLGSRIVNPWEFMRRKNSEYYAHDPHEIHYHLNYPSASMSWFGIESGNHFLYVARYDKEIRRCLLTIRQRIRRNPGNLMLGMDHFPMARPGEKLDLPTTVIGVLDGDWRTAARRYRAWAEENFYQVEKKAPWIQEMTGWQRIIMRSQYGEDYLLPEDLPRVYEVGAKYGLHTLFLFGWWKEGLDRGYPGYEERYPGSFKEIRENIEKVQAMGGRVILVAAGHLIDPSTEWYKTVGKDLAVIDINGEAIRYPFGPYPGAGAVRAAFGVLPMTAGCSCTQGWRDQQMKYLKKMNDMGADCLLIDCYGIEPNRLCFNDKHEHGNRVDEEWIGHRKAFEAARNYCAEEGKVLGTEVISDIAASYVQFVHGCDYCFTYGPGNTAFPALFRYTFPEVITTNRGVRHSHGDFRKQFKWSLVMGMRMDAELWVCRADIDQDPEYAAEVGKYTEYLNRYADYMLHGTFTVTAPECFDENVKCGEYIHKDGHKLLRVLYNISDEPVEAYGVKLDADELYFEEMEL